MSAPIRKTKHFSHLPQETSEEFTIYDHHQVIRELRELTRMCSCPTADWQLRGIPAPLLNFA